MGRRVNFFKKQNETVASKLKTERKYCFQLNSTKQNKNKIQKK